MAGLDFQVGRGEIHALVGENGAGKSTLMQVLSGRLVPEEGEVSILGRRMPKGSPKAAIEAGLGMVYQHFKLAPSLTVVENLLLGRQMNSFRLKLDDLAQKVEALGKEYKLEVPPHTQVWKLSMGERQRVEILRLLLYDARVLVFDEPTTILTPQETLDLVKALRFMRDQGRSVVFISHKLEEVLDLADRITILRQGRAVTTLNRGEADKESLAGLMIAGEWEQVSYRAGQGQRDEHAPLLELEDVSVRDDQGILRLKDLDLSLRPGEILGVAGVAGNGQRELADVCCGARTAEKGSVKVKGRDLTNKGPFAYIKAGVGYVPEDRHTDGSIGILNLMENLMLKGVLDRRFKRGPWLDWPAGKKHTESLILEYDIRPPDPKATAGSLSGGNLQKLLLARELDQKPKILVAAYPLRGLDLASASFVEKVLRNHADQGGAVLLISEDASQMLNIADRFVVLFRGSTKGPFGNGELNPTQIGLLMAGEELK